jgi:hypothetical protein
MSPEALLTEYGLIIFASCPYPLASSLWWPWCLWPQEPGPLSLDASEALPAT